MSAETAYISPIRWILLVELRERCRGAFGPFASAMQIEIHLLPRVCLLTHGAQVHLLHLGRRAAEARFVGEPRARFDERRPGGTTPVHREREVADGPVVERHRSLCRIQRVGVDDVGIVSVEQ